jgi:CBS domain-containing protein
MKVEQLMTRLLQTVRPGDSLAAAARIMWDQDCGCVPVVASTDDGGRRLVGMVTDRDVCMAGYTQGRPLAEIGVASAMAHDVATCGPRDTVAGALTVMRTRQLRRIPVVDEHEELVGLLSLADVAREAAREEGRRAKDVRFDEIGAALAAIDRPRAPAREVVAA